MTYTEKKKKRPRTKRLRRYLIAANVTVVVLFLLLLSMPTPHPVIMFYRPHSDADRLIEDIGIHLPVSYSNLTVERSMGQQERTTITVEIAASDLDDLLTQLPITPELANTGEPRYIYFPLDVDIETITYRYSLDTTGNTLQELFIDMSSPERYRVYLLILAG